MIEGLRGFPYDINSDFLFGVRGLRLRLRVHKGMKWNDHKGMERNGMYLSKRNEWKRRNGMEWNEVTLIGCFKINE